MDKCTNCSAMTHQCSQWMNTVKTLTGTNHKNTEKINALQFQVDTLTATNESLKTELSKAHSENAKLRVRIDELETSSVSTAILESMSTAIRMANAEKCDAEQRLAEVVRSNDKYKELVGKFVSLAKTIDDGSGIHLISKSYEATISGLRKQLAREKAISRAATGNYDCTDCVMDGDVETDGNPSNEVPSANSS